MIKRVLVIFVILTLNTPLFAFLPVLPVLIEIFGFGAEIGEAEVIGGAAARYGTKKVTNKAVKNYLNSKKKVKKNYNFSKVHEYYEHGKNAYDLLPNNDNNNNDGISSNNYQIYGLSGEETYYSKNINSPIVGGSINKDYIKLSFLTSGHFLTDNVFNYHQETEEKYFYFSFLFEDKKPKFDELTLYSIYSLNSQDISYQFKTTLKNNYFNKNQNNFLIDGGVGITIQPVNDIYTYVLFNGGVAINTQSKGFIYPEIGMTINEIFNMKSVIKFDYYIISNNEKLRTFEFHQSKFINKTSKIYGLFTLKNQRREFEFGIQKSF